MLNPKNVQRTAQCDTQAPAKNCVAIIDHLDNLRRQFISEVCYEILEIVVPNETSCGAVVFKKKGKLEYLLLHYEGGHWDFVKGQVEKGESERDTVIRELREETGIVDAHFIPDFREKISYFYRRRGMTIHKEVVFYLIQSRESYVKLSHEHVGFEWLNFEAAMRRLTFQNARHTLRKAHLFLKAMENSQS